ncbi:MAG: hypothetical protein L0207_01670 [Chlamydiae bacterium]|nr:hypothetical protein [Chlamydiota bacterium]
MKSVKLLSFIRLNKQSILTLVLAICILYPHLYSRGYQIAHKDDGYSDMLKEAIELFCDLKYTESLSKFNFVIADYTSNKVSDRNSGARD